MSTAGLVERDRRARRPASRQRRQLRVRVLAAAAARPQSACDSRLPPPSAARLALPAQFERRAAAGVADWKLPATIEPSIRASGDGCENHRPPRRGDRAVARPASRRAATIGCSVLPITASPPPPQRRLLKIVVSSIVSVVPEVALCDVDPPPRWFVLAPAWLPSIRLGADVDPRGPEDREPAAVGVAVPPVIRTRSKVAERVLPTKTFPPGSLEAALDRHVAHDGVGGVDREHAADLHGLEDRLADPGPGDRDLRRVHDQRPVELVAPGRHVDRVHGRRPVGLGGEQRAAHGARAARALRRVRRRGDVERVRGRGRRRAQAGQQCQGRAVRPRVAMFTSTHTGARPEVALSRRLSPCSACPCAARRCACLTASRTSTLPCVTRTSVVVQVSWTSQRVPRTVAAA